MTTPVTETTVVQGIADVLQRVYGDATQTVLDREAAREVWAYLLSRGVAPFEMVAALVEAAGGEIRIPDDLMAAAPCEVKTWRVVDPPELVVRVVK